MESIKWAVNHMPKTDDAQLKVMALSQVEKARAFHESFPQYSITPLARLDQMAKRLGLKGIAKEDLSKLVPLFIRQGYLLIPLVTLVAMVMMGYTMSRSAVIATLLAILVSNPQ